MLLGLRTVIYKVNDLAKAKKWFAEALGISPYFDQPYYVGFNVGGFELGLDPDSKNISYGNNVQAYWGVKEIEKEMSRLMSLGAVKNTDIQDVGEGIKVATVKDPFGNVFGIIQNPNFKFER